MAERRVSVRLTAVGGQALRAELVGIGQDGSRALTLIETAGPRAAAGLNAAGVSAGDAMRQMEALADRATRAAAALKAAGTVSGSVMGRVNATTGVSGGTTRDAADIAAYGAALDNLRAKHNPLFAVIRDYRSQLDDIRTAHRVGAISTEEMTAAISRERQASLASIAALKGRSTALDQMGRSSRNAAFQSKMLLFQLNDVFVSLAGGMNPMMVFTQQGSQIAQIYGSGQGGAGAALRDMGGMVRGVVTKFPLLTAAVAAGSLAILGMQHDINATTGASVSFGDTALAVWQVVRDGIWNVLRPAIETIAPWFWQAMDLAASAVVNGGNLIINTWKATVATIRTVFSAVPAVVGTIAIAAANAVIRSINWMIEKALGGINALIAAANAATARIPGIGADLAISPIDTAGLTIPTLDNPYRERVAESAGALREAIGEIYSGDPLGTFFNAVRDRAVDNSLRDTEEAAAGAGGAMQRAGEQAETAMAAARTGIDAVTDALGSYADEARDWGKGLGDTLVGAFQGAEEAVGEFVRTGKLNMSSLVTSMLADLAKLSVRQAVLAPAADWLSGTLGLIAGGSLFGGNAFGVAGSANHSGGRAGQGTPRMIPAAALAAAPRFHNGGGFMLGPDEQAAVLLRGERVLNRGQTRDWESGSGTSVNIYARDAQSFRQSRAQVAADIARAVAYGRRST